MSLTQDRKMNKIDLLRILKEALQKSAPQITLQKLYIGQVCH